MKAYSYDYNGLFIGEVECELCQVTEQLKMEQQARGLKEGEAPIESVAIIPSFSTLVPLPPYEEGKYVKFNGVSWDVEEIPAPVVEVKEPKPELSYEEKRANEYPSFTEYLDGIVKSHSKDQAMHEEGVAQIEKYISDCLAVKAKYPKPKGK